MEVDDPSQDPSQTNNLCSTLPNRNDDVKASELASWVPWDGRRAFQRAGVLGLANTGYNMTFTDQANISTQSSYLLSQCLFSDVFI